MVIYPKLGKNYWEAGKMGRMHAQDGTTGICIKLQRV